MAHGLPDTERASARAELDTLSTIDAVRHLHAAYTAVGPAVAAALPAIAAAAEALVARWPRGGRLILLGAGTSGRIAAAEAAECPPTFGTPPERVVAVLAGGETALARAVEGAEDDGPAGGRAVRDLAAGPPDVVVGVSAGGTAPFVLGGMAEASVRGAVTVALTAVAGSPLAQAVQIPVVVATGPEPVAGSTRMLAGSAQKTALNILTTAAMARLGHVHGDRMVDFLPTNAKLRARAVRTVAELARVEPAAARAALEAGGWRVKAAVVAARLGVSPAEAEALLAEAGGSLRRAMGTGA